MVFAFDQWLLGKFEAFAHWFQRLTGRTNLFLAKIALCVGATFWLFSMLSRQQFILFAIFGAIMFMRTLTMDWDEKKAYRRLEQGVANPGKITGFRGRLFLQFWFLLLAALEIPLLFVAEMKPLISAGQIFFVFAEYFEACDPLPPGTSKIREWLDSFGKKPVPASSRA